MTTIEKILSEIKIDDADLKLKKFCDDIAKEEESNYSVQLDSIPHGPTILLALECPKDIFGNIVFLCLEREFSDYIVSRWISKKGKLYKQYNDIIPFSSREPEKILTYYAKNLKILREGISENDNGI